MISKKTKYALIALSKLAEDYQCLRPLLIADLAKRGRVPRKFLEAILLELKNRGVLRSKKGKGGGYCLAGPPEKITLGRVIRILEGPLAPLPCVSQSAYQRCEECEDEDTCPLRLVMKEVREATAKILDGTSLKDMVERARDLPLNAMYFI